MRTLLRNVSAVVVLLAPALARADVAPDPDKWMACEGLKVGDSCWADIGMGFCVMGPCQADPSNTSCLVCDPNATATTGDASTGGSGGSSGTGGTGEGSSGTSDGPTTMKDDGCGCRSSGSAGALALLGLLAVGRRRTRAR